MNILHWVNVVLAAAGKDPSVALLVFVSGLFIIACLAIAALHVIRLGIGLLFVPDDEGPPPADESTPRKAA